MEPSISRLISYFSQPDLTPAQIGEDFDRIADELGRSDNSRNGRTSELAEQLDASVRFPSTTRPLDDAPDDSDRLPEDDGATPVDLKRQVVFDWVPTVRALGTTLIGHAGGEPCTRLRMASNQAREASGTIGAMRFVADEFEAAARQIEAGRPAPSLQTLAGLIRPDDRRGSRPLDGGADDSALLTPLSKLTADLTGGMRRFQGASFMATIDGDAAHTAGLVISGRDSVAADLAAATGQACRLMDSALIQAGQALIGMAGAMENLAILSEEPLTYCPGEEIADCMPGQVKKGSCKVLGFFYFPAGIDVDIDKLLGGFLSYLEELVGEKGSDIEKLVGKALSPGGTDLLQGIITGVEKIRETRKKQIRTFVGYNVYAILRYEQCVKMGDATVFQPVTENVKLSADPANFAAEGKRMSLVWKSDPIELLRRGKGAGKTADDALVRRLLDAIKNRADLACKNREAGRKGKGV